MNHRFSRLIKSLGISLLMALGIVAYLVGTKIDQEREQLLSRGPYIESGDRSNRREANISQGTLTPLANKHPSLDAPLNVSQSPGEGILLSPYYPHRRNAIPELSSNAKLFQHPTPSENGQDDPPRFYAALLESAESYILLGDESTGLLIAEDAVTAYPDDPEVRRVRANLLQMVGRFEEATEEYERIIPYMDDQTFDHLVLAQLRLKIGKLDEAMEALGIVLQDSELQSSALEILKELNVSRNFSKEGE